MDWGAQLQELLHGLVLFLPKLITAVAVFIAALVIGGLVASAVKKAVSGRVKDEAVARLLARLARWVVVILGTLTALEQVNFDITSFVAGLGIIGFAAGFAMQDIARNFVAGILLLIRRPFEIGDAVEAAGVVGTVMDISIRDTVIKSLDGEKVIVPNSDIFVNSIINYSDLPLRRRTVMIGLGYGEDVDRAVGVFMQAISSVDGVLDDPAPSLHAEGLGDSALTLAARFWVDQTTHGLLDVHSAVVQAIKEAAERERIDLPYPTQIVQVKGDWSPGA